MAVGRPPGPRRVSSATPEGNKAVDEDHSRRFAAAAPPYIVSCLGFVIDYRKPLGVAFPHAQLTNFFAGFVHPQCARERAKARHFCRVKLSTFNGRDRD